MKKGIWLSLILWNLTTAFGQIADISCVRLDNEQNQSFLLFRNAETGINLLPNTIKNQDIEDGVLYAHLNLTGDFDNDGTDETALFYHYSYYPNTQPSFTCSKVMLYKSLNEQTCPIGCWESQLKSELDFSKVTYSGVGDFDGDGIDDIALIWDDPLVETQTIYVLRSDGTRFLNPEVYFQIDRTSFNFSKIKFLFSSDYNSDNKNDILALYKSGNVTQYTYWLESTSSSFNQPKIILETSKSSLDFNNIKNADAGYFNNDNKEDILIIENKTTSNNQRLIVLENNYPDPLVLHVYNNIERETINFSNSKHELTGSFNNDAIDDIALLYSNPITGNEEIWVAYGTPSQSFSPFENKYSTASSNFSFNEVLTASAGNFVQHKGVSPTLWKNNHRGAATFGFDDGYTDAFYFGANYLNSLQLKGTFFIINNKAYGNDPYFAYWDTLQYHAAKGHEICSHTMSHTGVGSVTEPGELYDLLMGSKLDLDNQLSQNTLSMSYPYGDFSYASLSETANYYKTARSSHEGFNLLTPIDFHALKSHYISSTTTVEQVTNWLQTTEDFQYYVSLMFHNLKLDPFDKAANPYSYSYEDFKQVVGIAQQKDLWIATQASVYKYIRERNALRVNYYDLFGDQVTVQVDDDLDNETYNEPLTLKIALPSTWNVDSVGVYDNGQSVNVKVHTEGLEKYCYYNDIPDNGYLAFSLNLSTSDHTTTPDNNYSITVCNDNETAGCKVIVNGKIESRMTLHVYNTLGVEIMSHQPLECNSVYLPQSKLTKGYYVFTLQQNGEVLAKTKGMVY